MKQKLFSIMLLVFGAVLGVQAEDQTLVDFPSSMDGISISGTTASGVVKIHTDKDEVTCLSLKNGYTTDSKFNGNAIILSVEGGFKSGDVVTIAGAINNSDATKRATAVLFTMDGDSKITKLNQFSDFINSKLVADDPAEEAYTLETDADKLYIGRDGNTQANFVLIKVVRAAGGDEAGTPAITFEAPAVERTITIGLASAGQKAIVDWGDGVKNEMEAKTDTWGDVQGLEFIGTPSGTVKVYGENIVSFAAYTKYDADAETITDGITSIDLSNATSLTELDIHQNNLKTVDLSKLTALEKLTIGVNDFETFDISSNTELTNLDASNGKANGLLSSIDLSKNTKLTSINLSGNKLTSVDLSNNTLAKTVQLLNNQLTSVNLGANSSKNHTINLGNNKLTEVDLSKFTNLTGSYIYLRDNDLTGTGAIKLPEGATVRRLWVDGNAFTLSQLYGLKGLATQTFTYATTYSKPDAQQPMDITADGNKVDLSSEAVLGEATTVFTWKTSEGTVLVEGTDYTVENGVFTFLTDQEGIYCEMTNAELPLFTADKPFKTIPVSVSGSAPSEVDNSALLAEITEAGKLLRRHREYYDENNTESPDDAGKVLVDAIRNAESTAESATTQKKIEKALAELIEAEEGYTNALMEYELAESEEILTGADPEEDELAAEIKRLCDLQDIVRKDESNQPKNIWNYAELIDDAQVAYLQKAINELLPEARAMGDDAARKAVEKAEKALEGVISEILFDALKELREALGIEPTGIRGVEAERSDAPAYNLAGQRVNGNAKGIIIKNGKKVVVK